MDPRDGRGASCRAGDPLEAARAGWSPPISASTSGVALPPQTGTAPTVGPQVPEVPQTAPLLVVARLVSQAAETRRGYEARSRRGQPLHPSRRLRTGRPDRPH